MGIKEIIENIETGNENLIITSYGMDSDIRDESYRQTVRIGSARDGEVNPDEFNDGILPELLKAWAGNMGYRTILDFESLKVYAIGENEVMDTITIHYSDAGYYITRVMNGQW